MSTEEALLAELIDPEQLKKDVAIDLADINTSMQHHAGLYVHYATLAVRARGQLDRWKRALQILEAQLNKEYRESMGEEGKKPTEPAIAAAVVNDSRWRACNSRVLQAQQVHRLAEVGESAFGQRKDMLLQIARNQAKEADGQLRVSLNQDSRSRVLAAIKGADQKD
jgi:hypothetical protein